MHVFIQDITQEGDGKGVEADPILHDSYDGNVCILCPPGLLVHDVDVLLMSVLGMAEFSDCAFNLVRVNMVWALVW
jgi:hypothetical protein